MKEDARFSTGWRVAIIVALALAVVGRGVERRQRQAEEERVAKRIEKLEESIKRMETYLYDEVATAIRKP